MTKPEQNSERLNIDRDFVEAAINGMDSEWDKNVLRVIVGATRSRKQRDDLGIYSHDIKLLT